MHPETENAGALITRGKKLNLAGERKKLSNLRELENLDEDELGQSVGRKQKTQVGNCVIIVNISKGSRKYCIRFRVFPNIR